MSTDVHIFKRQLISNTNAWSNLSSRPRFANNHLYCPLNQLKRQKLTEIQTLNQASMSSKIIDNNKKWSNEKSRPLEVLLSMILKAVVQAKVAYFPLTSKGLKISHRGRSKVSNNTRPFLMEVIKLRASVSVMLKDRHCSEWIFMTYVIHISHQKIWRQLGEISTSNNKCRWVKYKVYSRTSRHKNISTSLLVYQKRVIRPK